MVQTMSKGLYSMSTVVQGEKLGQFLDTEMPSIDNLKVSRIPVHTILCTTLPLVPHLRLRLLSAYPYAMYRYLLIVPGKYFGCHFVTNVPRVVLSKYLDC